MELDWSVGQIMNALGENGLEENTVVMFTSDNGLWTLYGNHTGKTPYKAAKETSFDGGTQSACVVKSPGVIKGGSVAGWAWCSIDVLPTFAALAGAELPEYSIDGKDVFHVIANKPGASDPHDYYACSTVSDLEAVISGTVGGNSTCLISTGRV